MRTNIEIDDALMANVLSATGLKTKREAVALALETLLRFKAQDGVRSLWGIGWDGDLDAMRTDR